MLRLSTCSNRPFSDETEKNFSRVSCRFRQSTNICLTVSGNLQDLQTGWSSADLEGDNCERTPLDTMSVIRSRQTFDSKPSARSPPNMMNVHSNE